jgi:hypothetical protein
MHGLRRTYHRLKNSFGGTQWNSLVTGHEEYHFSLFGDIVSVDARKVHSVHQTYHWLRNHFVRNRWYTLVTGLN